MSDNDERVNSICSVYADIIETEVKSDDTDVEKVDEMLGYIRNYCSTVGFEPGETPDHLEEYLFD